VPGSASGETRHTVVHVAAEFWPYARTGGLGEAVRGMARHQARAGERVIVVMPLYRAVREAGYVLEPAGAPLAIPVGPGSESVRLWRLAGPPPAPDGPTMLFLDHPSSFDRPGVYGEGGADYPDNGPRFAVFVRGALAALPRIAAAPILLHAHDWHTALAPVFLRAVLADEPWTRDVAVVLSVHNAGFQGHFPRESLAEVGLPDALYHWQRLEWFGRVNWLKGGLTFTDYATTVSPTHAHELRTEAGGFGLHDTFVGLKDRFVGIRNGIDLTAWNPAADPHIAQTYSSTDLSGKRRCKAVLQQVYGLPQEPGTLLFGMTARLVAQKGLDLLLGGHALWSAKAQFVFLGAGEERYESALREIADAAPHRVAADFAFTDAKEHVLLAGADALLMPSLYEPCGLTQMRAQRYGALPLARRVGGLADTIEDQETGFLFDDYTAPAFEQAVRRAVDLYDDPDAWRRHMGQAMARDFGWSEPAARYVEVYERAFERARARP
jgi:starch synthase